MESRRAGVLRAMLLEMERVAQSTCQNSDQKELNLVKEMMSSLHQVQSHSEKSIQH